MMRRKDREMDEAFALEIIDEAAFGVLSLCSGQAPYGVPLSLVREGRRLYFHSAREGKKIDGIGSGDPVWVTFVARVRVPDLFSPSELEAIAADPAKTGKLISSVFTTEFASAMVSGTIHEVDDQAEKIHALELVCSKYTPDKMKYFKAAVTSGLDLTRVFAIDIGQVTGKRKRYDSSGAELKFGRRES